MNRADAEAKTSMLYWWAKCRGILSVRRRHSDENLSAAARGMAGHEGGIKW